MVVSQLGGAWLLTRQVAEYITSMNVRVILSGSCRIKFLSTALTRLLLLQHGSYVELMASQDSQV